jgi:hypothetical protein
MPLSHGPADSQTPCLGGFKQRLRYISADYDHRIRDSRQPNIGSISSQGLPWSLKKNIRLALTDWHTIWVTRFPKEKKKVKKKTDRTEISMDKEDKGE